MERHRRIGVPDVADHREASELGGGRGTQPGHEIGTVNQGRLLAPQLPSQLDGRPEKRPRPAIAQFNRAVRSGRKAGRPEERLNSMALGGTEREMLELSSARPASYPDRRDLGARHGGPGHDVRDPVGHTAGWTEEDFPTH